MARRAVAGPRGRREPADDGARGPERVAHGASGARRGGAGRRRTAAAARRRHPLELAVQLLVGFFGARQRAAGLLERLRATAAAARPARARTSSVSRVDYAGRTSSAPAPDRFEPLTHDRAGDRGSRSRATCARATLPRACPSSGWSTTSRIRPRDFVEIRIGPDRAAHVRAVVALERSSVDSGNRKLFSAVMKSMLPEYAVAITGFPRRIDSSIVRPKPSERCGET